MTTSCLRRCLLADAELSRRPIIANCSGLPDTTVDGCTNPPATCELGPIRHRSQTQTTTTPRVFSQLLAESASYSELSF